MHLIYRFFQNQTVCRAEARINLNISNSGKITGNVWRQPFKIEYTTLFDLQQIGIGLGTTYYLGT